MREGLVKRFECSFLLFCVLSLFQVLRAGQYAGNCRNSWLAIDDSGTVKLAQAARTGRLKRWYRFLCGTAMHRPARFAPALENRTHRVYDE